MICEGNKVQRCWSFIFALAIVILSGTDQRDTSWRSIFAFDVDTTNYAWDTCTKIKNKKITNDRSRVLMLEKLHLGSAPSSSAAHTTPREATLFPPVCQTNCQTRARGCAPAAPSFRKSAPTDSTSAKSHRHLQSRTKPYWSEHAFQQRRLLLKVSVFFRSVVVSPPLFVCLFVPRFNGEQPLLANRNDTSSRLSAEELL